MVEEAAKWVEAEEVEWIETEAERTDMGRLDNTPTAQAFVLTVTKGHTNLCIAAK